MNSLMEHKKVTIVIPNWNGHKDTVECLNSLESLTYSNYEIVVIDNGSTDGSVAMLRESNPDIMIVELPDNTGFTGACNEGIKMAVESGSEYVFLLNNDTVLNDADMLEKMSGYLEDNTDVGMLAPVTLYHDTNKVWFAGGELDRNTGILKLWGQGEEYTKDNEHEAVYCTFLVGCALFVRTELLQKIGGLYQPYFLTSEESELCVNIMDHGYKLAVLCNVSLFHKVSRSMGVESPLLTYFLYRNKLLFAKRNAVNFSVSDLFKITAYYLRGFLSAIKRGNYGAAMGVVRGVWDFILGKYDKGYYEGKL